MAYDEVVAERLRALLGWASCTSIGGYAKATLVDDVIGRRGDVFCKPWMTQNKNRYFTKAQFRLNLRAMTITCPAGEIEPATFGEAMAGLPNSSAPPSTPRSSNRLSL